jgi:hypothetical protein
MCADPHVERASGACQLSVPLDPVAGAYDEIFGGPHGVLCPGGIGLKTFHDLVDETASSHGGLVVNFMGDGAMVVFGALDPDPTRRMAGP